MTTRARLLWVDTETSGLVKGKGVKQNQHFLLQLAAVITDPIDTLPIKSYFMTYIKPSSESKLIWDPGAEAVHGISQEFLKNEPDEKMAMEAFVAFCQANFPLRIAGFNCPFDNAVIDAAIDRQQCFLPEFVTPFYDVMDVAKEQLSLPRNRLVDIREHFGISCSGAHDAARDIYDTLKIARLLRAMKKAAA